MTDKCNQACIGAGFMFGRAIRDDPAVFPENVKGLVREDAYKVPHSELAMHVQAAGQEVLAWSLTEGGNYAQIVYEDKDGCCRFTHGLPTEVLSHDIIRVTRDMLGMTRGR